MYSWIGFYQEIKRALKKGRSLLPLYVLTYTHVMKSVSINEGCIFLEHKTWHYTETDINTSENTLYPTWSCHINEIVIHKSQGFTKKSTLVCGTFPP